MGDLIGAMAGTAVKYNATGEEAKASLVENQANIATAKEARADAIARGNLEAGKVQMQGGQLAAKQYNAFANSGVDPTVGTPASVMADTRMMSELDAQTIKNNAAREAWGFKKQEEQYTRKKDMDIKRANSELGGTLLTGLGKFASAGSKGGM